VLRAGDAALFRAGLSMTWDIPHYVRKVWVHRYPTPNLLERAAIKLTKLLGTFAALGVLDALDALDTCGVVDAVTALAA
jgi:hypothetical protein